MTLKLLKKLSNKRSSRNKNNKELARLHNKLKALRLPKKSLSMLIHIHTTKRPKQLNLRECRLRRCDFQVRPANKTGVTLDM